MFRENGKIKSFDPRDVSRHHASNAAIPPTHGKMSTRKGKKGSQIVDK